MNRPFCISTTFGIAICVLVYSVQPVYAQLSLDSHHDECIVHNPVASISGNAGGNVQLYLNGNAQPQCPIDANQRWQAQIQLQKGVNVIRLSHASHTTLWHIIYYTDSIPNHGTMKVFLDWQVDTDKRLQEIGRASLDSFSATEANVFSSTVPTKIRYLIQEIFATVGLAVEFVDMPGNDVHQIIMSAETKRPRPGFLIFGETEPILDNSTMFPTVDYGDMAKSDVCTVYLGSIRDSLRKAPRAGNGLRIPEWSPMRTDDSFETRLDDVAFFLASTCTHELGHSLGLVAFQDTLPGGWMLGSPGGHNPFGVDFIKKLRDIDDKIPETILQRRFQGGGFVMDDELQAERSLRFGRTRPYGERSIVKFNSANSAYLQLLY